MFRRAVGTATTVLLSWLAGWIVLAYLGWLPALGLAPVLLWIDDVVASVGSVGGPATGAKPSAPALSNEAQSLVDRADELVSKGQYAEAAPLYVEALRRSEGQPGLYFSIARCWRLAGNPLRAAAYMLAYLEETSLPDDVRRQLLQEVNAMSTVAGATARELFAIATEAVARLPVDDRPTARQAVAAAIASSGDVEALEIIARRWPEGLPEALGPAAIEAAKAGQWTLARRMLKVAGDALPGAARSEAFDHCRHIVDVQPACARVVLHRGFGGLPPVTSAVHCLPETPVDMARREQNLAGVMMIGLAVQHYRLYQRSEARRLWEDGHRLLRASGLGSLCRQPWYAGVYVPLQVGDNWAFMAENGPLNLPGGEDQMPSDGQFAGVTWRAVVDPADRLNGTVLPDVREQVLHDAIGLPDMPMLMRDMAGLEPVLRPVRLAEIGRDYFRVFAAIRETLDRLESETK